MINRHPKISIITPVYNQSEYIEATILSVINQSYPNLEYVIIDGGSTDGTLDILKKYEDKITKWISEPDHGMYDAINKGFSKTSGEIMAWINSDDILLPNSLFNMARLFNDLEHVNWIQGLNSFIDLEGNVINTNSPIKYSFIKFLNRDFKWIQQESTFWRRCLWLQTGSKVNDSLKLAGDFELWFRFFQSAKLYNVNVPIGAWRKREGQLSGTHMESYLLEADEILKTYKIQEKMAIRFKKIKNLNYFIKIFEKLKIFNSNYLIKERNKYYNLERLEIHYSYEQNKFII